MLQNDTEHLGSRLVRRTVLYLPSQLISAVAQLAGIVLWTYWLDPAEVGLLALIWAMQEVLFHLGLSWWTFYALRYGADTSDGCARLFDQANRLVSGLGCLLIGLVSWLSIDLIAPTGFRTTVLALSVVAFVVVRSLATHFSELARARSCFGDYALLQISGSLGGLSAGLLGSVLVAPTASVVLAAFAIVQAFGVLCATRNLITQDDRGAELSMGSLSATIGPVLMRAFNYGAPIMLANAFFWVTAQSLRLTAEYFEGLTAVALITIGWGLAQRLMAVASSLIVTGSFPLAVERLNTAGADEALAVLAQSGILLLALLTPLTVGTALISTDLVTFLVPESYRTATSLVLPVALALSLVQNLRIHVANQTFLLFERPHLALFTTAGGAFLALLCSFAGQITGLGPVGAVTGALVGELVTAIATFALAQRLFGLKLPFGAIAAVVAATLGMSLALLGTSPLLTEHRGIHIGFQIAVGVLTYGALTLTLGPKIIRQPAGRAFAKIRQSFERLQNPGARAG